MLNVSAEWQRSVMLDDNRQYLAFADIVLSNGKKLAIDNSKLWEDGFSVEDATSEDSTFTIGGLVASKLTIKLNNIYDDYSEYDFTDAKATAYIGKQLDSGLEKLKIGEFTVNETDYNGSIITLECLDNVNQFNKAYDSTLSYPATIYEIVRNACLDCGVPFTMARFDNSDYVVETKPDNKNTYGQVIAYALQICGSWGKCDHEGALTIGWYDMAQFENKNYFGGTFSTKTTPYSDGDTLNGGSFKDYSSGDTASGGTFTEARKYHNLYGMKEFTVAADDVVITGIKVSVTSSESESKDVECLAGNEGYVISISNNPLISTDKAETVANYVYKKIGGMRFRPLSGSFLSDPTIESGDVALVTDRKQNVYNAFISNRTFSIGNSTSISCDAESAARNSADSFSAGTKTIIEARKTAQKQISAYDTQVQLLTQLMSQSFGLFKTEQAQEDGSTIYIMHNKSDLKSSQIQWKMTANGMAVSSDYGKTWNAGVDSSGNAVFNIMSAIGINFDWAHGGTLTLGGENNVSGKQYVKDSKGNILVTLDNRGITLASGVTISWENISGTPTIPTSTSQLENDSNYATKSEIPTSNSQLANDSNYTTMTDVENKGYTTMTEVEKQNYTTMAKVLEKGYQNSDQVVTITKNTVTAAFIKTLGLLVGDQIQMGPKAKITWANVTDQPTIPSKTSELMNDSSYATTEQIPTNNNQLSNGAGYTTKSDLPTKVSELENDEGYVVPSQLTDFITSNDLDEYGRTHFTKDLNELKNNIGYTEIDKQYVISPIVYAGKVISSDFTGGTINIGNGVFTVDDTGKVSASNMNITGGGISLQGNLSDSKIALQATDNSGNNYELWMNGAVLRIVKNDENLITLYGVTGTVGAQDMYAQLISADKFRETDRGTAMCGDEATHTYHCGWTGTQLRFQVDTTWVWSSSDKRLKKNIKSIDKDFIEAVGSAKLCQYNLNRQGYLDSYLHFGAIAQDILTALKDKGHSDDELKMIFQDKVSEEDDTLYYGMDYEQFLILRTAYNEQRIEKMQKHIDNLENKFSRLCEKLGIDESEV